MSVAKLESTTIRKQRELFALSANLATIASAN